MRTIGGEVYNATLSCNDLSEVTSDQNPVFYTKKSKLKLGSKLVVKTSNPKQKYACMIQDVKSRP